jgi:hypothetical protein
MANGARNCHLTSSILRYPQQRGMVMMMLIRTTLLGALLMSCAHAQQMPSPDGPLSAPMYEPMPVMVPLPPNGCVWAGRPFSDGAGFCVADKLLQTCTIGKWSRENSENCHGALADTR